MDVREREDYHVNVAKESGGIVTGKATHTGERGVVVIRAEMIQHPSREEREREREALSLSFSTKNESPLIFCVSASLS